MNRFQPRRIMRATGAATAVAAGLLAPASAHAAQDYVVVLKPPAEATCQQTVRDVSAAYAVSPKVVYESSFCGFSASLSKRTVEALKLDFRVQQVHADSTVGVG